MSATGRERTGGRLLMFDVFVGALAAVLVLWAVSINQQKTAEPKERLPGAPYGLQLRIVAADAATFVLRVADAQGRDAGFLLRPLQGCRGLSPVVRYCGETKDGSPGITYVFSAPTSAPGSWSYDISYYEPPATNALLAVARVHEIGHLDRNGKTHTCSRGSIHVALGKSSPTCVAAVARALADFGQLVIAPVR